ncbi:MAG: high-affinity iron transporter [Actinomycetota bacterium]|nr:high-affinity iron transporter [Actinomycetota bacterium]
MTGTITDHRPPLRRLLPAVLLAAALWWLLAPAAGAAGSVSRTAAVRQLDQVRQSIDQTLERVKSGDAQDAFAEAKSGYLNHFELVEIPLRVVAPRLTADAETKFAEIRGLISGGAPTGQIRDAVIELRRLINDSERELTSTGLGAPSVVAGQSFLIIFREGLEAVLLLSALLGYLEAAKASQYRKPVVIGMGAAVAASVVIFFVLRVVLDSLPFGREVLEAVTAIVATVVLFYVSFWLIARLEQRRWLEFLRSRVWSAVSVGSTTALVLVGFTAVFREGFETSLMYQALVSFGTGLVGWILLGLALGLAALTVVAYGIFKLGRKLPIKTFLSGAVVLLMATSVAFLGNAVRSLQEADVIGLTPLHGWPRAPIFLSQALGYWPSKETVLTQAVLALVYVAGAVYMFVIRPRAASKPPARPKEERAPVHAPARQPAQQL